MGMNAAQLGWQTRGMSLVDRIMHNVFMIPESTCWYWSRHHDSDGYAGISIGGRHNKKTRHAHRVAYEALIGPVPDGMHLDHICRDRGCVNPKHLEPVTPRENVMRSPIAPAALNANATHCKRGHELSGDNLCPKMLVSKSKPQRRCLICLKQYQKDTSARLRAETFLRKQAKN